MKKLLLSSALPMLLISVLALSISKEQPIRDKSQIQITKQNNICGFSCDATNNASRTTLDWAKFQWVSISPSQNCTYTLNLSSGTSYFLHQTYPCSGSGWGDGFVLYVKVIGTFTNITFDDPYVGTTTVYYNSSNTTGIYTLSDGFTSYCGGYHITVN